MSSKNSYNNINYHEVPNFIERLLFNIGNEFTEKLWEGYDIGVNIKNYDQDF